ncbi:MAG: hypothetical protein AAB691_02280, partial [Patescibacteria group bacterium]
MTIHFSPSVRKRFNNLRLLVRSSWSVIRHPLSDWPLRTNNSFFDRQTVAISTFLWGGVFIILNFLFAQRVSIFWFNHWPVKILSSVIYGFLIWYGGALFFFLVAKLFRKETTLARLEMLVFPLWLTWALMPFFDLPHLLFSIPMVYIWGAGAHLSWLLGFPMLAFLSFSLMRYEFHLSKREMGVAMLLAGAVPVIGRFVIEKSPFWFDAFVLSLTGKGMGFHSASLLAVLVALPLAFLLRHLTQPGRSWTTLFSPIIFLVLVVPLFVITAQQTSWTMFIPGGKIFNFSRQIEGDFGPGESRYRHSYVWTGGDYETSTITHGGAGIVTAYYSDYYVDVADLDFNPTLADIREIRILVDFTGNTNLGSTNKIQGCFAADTANASGTFYCSDWQNSQNSTSTFTFRIRSDSIFTFATSSDGAATSTAAWNTLISALTQDDNDVAVHAYVTGSDDGNNSNDGKVEFTNVNVEVEYKDYNELITEYTYSTSTQSTTSTTAIPILTLPSSSLPNGTYFVTWGMQASADATSLAIPTVSLRQETGTIIATESMNLNTVTSTDPTKGSFFGGFWAGTLDGASSLSLYGNSLFGTVGIYFGTRYISATRLDTRLTANQDYWSNSNNSTADVLTDATTTFTVVTSTTATFHTEATAQPFLLFASMTVNPDQTARYCSAQVKVSSTASVATYGVAYRRGVSGSDVWPYTFATQLNLASGSVTVSLEGKTNAAAAACDYAQPRIFIVRASLFDTIGNSSATAAVTINTSSLTTLTTTSFVPQEQGDALIVGNSLFSPTSSRAMVLTTNVSGTSNIFLDNLGLLGTAVTSTWPVTTVYVYRNISSTVNFALSAHGVGTASTTFASSSYLTVWSLQPPISYTQSGYRWYANSDATSTGAALAATNTAAFAPVQGTPFRLRSLLHIGSSTLSSSSQPFKLQYAEKSGTCDTAFSGETYGDVGRTSGAIRFYNNASVSDGVRIATSSGDPVHGSDTVVAQSYEEANSFVAVTSTASSSDAMWDFSLVDNSAVASTTYCFRAVQIGDVALDAYSVIPEITTKGAAPALGSVTLNNGSDISLTPATTTRIYASSSVVSDADGAGDILYATSTFYRSGVTGGQDCVANDLNCYQTASSSCSFAASTSTVSCYTDIWYFAQATDASSSFSAESWQAAISVTDKQAVSTRVSSTVGTVQIISLIAIGSATSSLN